MVGYEAEVHIETVTEEHYGAFSRIFHTYFWSCLSGCCGTGVGSLGRWRPLLGRTESRMASFCCGFTDSADLSLQVGMGTFVSTERHYAEDTWDCEKIQVAQIYSKVSMWNKCKSVNYFNSPSLHVTVISHYLGDWTYFFRQLQKHLHLMCKSNKIKQAV